MSTTEKYFIVITMNKNKLKTNNALSYRVDLKMEVLSSETESWKRITVIPVLIGILRTS